MSTEKPTRDTIFCAAVEIVSAEERTAYITTACGDDSDLRARVEKLVEAHFRAGSFLDAPAVPGLAGKLAPAPLEGETQACDSAAPDAADDLGFLAASDQPGSLGRIGHYEIQEVVGRGGMGVVLRAFDGKLHRVVAIKVMAAQLATIGTARKRFTREAQAAAAVSHDHIVTIHAVEEANGLPYLVMHFVSGVSLQERIDRNGPLQIAEIVRIGMQTAAGLAAAHAQGLVHRDIKPANILLENGIERVKITDFGLARAASDASLTQSGVVAGTPQFMSPEQARGEAVDQRTDLFSLGSVLYAMCTGRAPFRAGESMAVLKRVCEETPRPIRETNSDIPDWLVAIIDKLHAKDPADRYQTAAEVAALLNQHLAHLQHPSVAPMPVTKPVRLPAARPRRVAAAVAMLCLTAAVIGVSAALLGVFDPEAPVEKDRPTGKGPTETVAKPDKHPFMVLGGKGKLVAKFETLAEAVQAASAGDIIEIRGNGPFVGKPINIGKTALTIRAGAGFRPVIKPSPSGDTAIFLATDAALVLEGLDVRPMFPEDQENLGGSIQSTNAPLRAANCKFHGGIWMTQSPVAEFRNCEFLLGRGWWSCYGQQIGSGARILFENCLCRSNGHALHLFYTIDGTDDVSIQIRRSTFTSKRPAVALALNCPMPAGMDGLKALKPIRLEVSGSVFDSTGILGFSQQQRFIDKAGVLPPAEADAMLLRLLEWRGERNLFPAGSNYVYWYVNLKPQPSRGPKGLDEWRKFSGSKESDSRDGRPRFHGGNLLTRAELDQLTPEDFRLRPDSDGYQAGKDGNDLGADVNLVGPGTAYARWKQTSEYQQWLTETGQVTK